MLRSATAKMLPPRPPSPPSGPPLGMNFSRRKLATPLPPLPAMTSMVASSTNFISNPEAKKPCRMRQGFCRSGNGAPLLGCHDRHDLLVQCALRSEEHTSELQSLMRSSYAVFGLKKKKQI